MASKKVNMLDVVQKILKLDTKMRFAAIIDPKGNIREAIMKTGKTNLKNQKCLA
jgi:predicted transport protein